MSDLGPRAAARIRERLAGERFERDADERAIMDVVAREIAEILRPVAKPLDVVAFPRPQVILVIGVNGSGKRSEEHTSELQSLMRISYAVFCLKKKKKTQN